MMLKTINAVITPILAASLLLSCNESDLNQNVSETPEQNAPATGEVTKSEQENFVVDTLSNELSNPWGIAFLPDGKILVTEKAGEIRIFKDGALLPEKMTGVPEVFASGQGGLLDIKTHPDYADNGWIYITYSKPGEGGAATAMIRGKIDGNALVQTEELFRAQPYIKSGHHFGSRIAFDGKGHVFVSTGERGTKPNAQNLENHYGKVIRLNEDGSVPNDNPFVNTPKAKPEIWSYGHRNVQGMVYDDASNTLFAHEHGPKGGDEINIVLPGKNYGWPVITYGIDYDGSTISEISEKEGLEQPIHYWDPSIAPCGMAIVTSNKFPNWKGDLLIGALSHTHVVRVELDNKTFAGEEKLLEGVGRVRAVAESPDGFIYVATESPGMLLKLSPTN